MIKLDKNSLAQYIRKFVIPNLPWAVGGSLVKFEEISQFTNVNYLFRVYLKTDDGEKSVVLKYSREFVKAKPDMQFDVRRNYYEAKVLKRFAQIWGKEVVPTVYYHDEENQVNILEDFGKDCLVIAKELEIDRLHPEICQTLGTRLALLHSSTLETTEIVRDSQAEEDDYRKFFLNFKMAGSKMIDETATDNLITESSQTPSSLIWGDPVTKNILLKDNRVFFLDFEGSLRWDPAFDLGHMYAHWLIKYLENPDLIEQVKQCVVSIFNGYQSKMRERVDSNIVEYILERSRKHAGATILHRLRGLSQFKFSEERKQEMTETGRRLLREGGNLYE
jgi:tRNA A-37 threonylcarbamoyl transferase component Bud32